MTSEHHYPSPTVPTELTSQDRDKLAVFLVEKFPTAGEFQVFLQAHVWPAYKRRQVPRKNTAVSPFYKTLDGGPVTMSNLLRAPVGTHFLWFHSDDREWYTVQKRRGGMFVKVT